MNVADSVETTLTEIANGVTAAHKRVTGTGAEFNPLRRGEQNPLVRGAEIRDVEFDIAVVASSESSSGGELKVGIPSIGAGLGGGVMNPRTGSDSKSRSDCRVSGIRLKVTYPDRARRVLAGISPPSAYV